LFAGDAAGSGGAAQRGFMPAPRRTVGKLGGSGVAAGTAGASIAAAALDGLGAATGTVSGKVAVAAKLGVSVVAGGLTSASAVPGLTPSARVSAEFVVIRS
jgi:hypothetical protein